MKLPPSALAITVGLVAVSAIGSPPQPYTLGPSNHIQENCLPPCLCPYHKLHGTVSGGFLLTFLFTDPLGFDTYRVTALEGLVTINNQPLPFQGSGTYRIGSPLVVAHRLVLTVQVGQDEPRDYDSGFVAPDPGHPFPEIAIHVDHESVCRHYSFTLQAAPDGCYADCDGGGSLTIADFSCFQSKFAKGEPWADCNASGTLTIADFGCFQSAFGAGCP